MFAKACFDRRCVFIAVILFFLHFLIFFHLLVKLFKLPAVFGLVNKDLQKLIDSFQ